MEVLNKFSQSSRAELYEFKNNLFELFCFTVLLKLYSFSFRKFIIKSLPKQLQLDWFVLEKYFIVFEKLLWNL